MSISPLKGSPLASPEYGTPRASRSTTRLAQQQTTRCTITLEQVIGNTVNGPNGFCTSFNGSFAISSGSTAIVNKISPDLTVKQQVYRAPVRAAPELLSGIDSVQNSPFRSRGRQVPRASILGGDNFLPDLKDSPSAKAAVHKKPKGISCLALSPNGQFLAVGETGYVPRILLFALTLGIDAPVSVAAEHISGIQTLCFSPNSKWLCSVGDIYDGCIYVWSVGSKGVIKLHASSKCTSTVNDMKWLYDRSIITAGVRHLKIWRPDVPSQPPSPLKSIISSRTRNRQDSPLPASPGPTSLPGRNVLLGDLLESSFTAVCSIGDSKALVGSEPGDISVVNLEKGTQKLELIANLGAPIKCIVFDQKGGLVIAATSNARLWTCKVSHISFPGIRSDTFGRFKSLDMNSSPLAIGLVEDRLLWVDERRYMSVYSLSNLLTSRISKSDQAYPAHSVAVNGIALSNNKTTTSLLSYDAFGHLISWNSALICTGQYDIPLGLRSSEFEYEPNELKVVRQISRDQSMICGDRYGSLSLFTSSWCFCYQVQAHTSDINDIALIELPEIAPLVITCGRDRVIQLLQINNLKFELSQTVEQHNGSVNKLEVIEQDGTLLLSLSSDRTILVHKLVQLDNSHALLCVRIITLKSTPFSCAFDATGSSLLSVTTADKQLQIFQLKTGSLENSIRIVDDEDQIALQEIAIKSVGSEEKSLKLLIGISNTDKALRVHNAQSGEMLCKAGGHSESITSLTVMEENLMGDGSLVLKLVTTSLDGTVMLWKLHCQAIARDIEPKEGLNSREPRQTPLRKVLSKSRLAGFAATLESTEWSPLPSPTRERAWSRNPSPDRLRRRTSVPNLLRDASTPILAPPTPRHNREISPGPDTSFPPRRRSTASRSDLLAKDSSDMPSSSKILLNSLKSFRTTLRTRPNELNDSSRNELKLELEMTLDALTRNQGSRDDLGKDDSYFSAIDGIQSMTIAEDEEHSI